MNPGLKGLGGTNFQVLAQGLQVITGDIALTRASLMVLVADTVAANVTLTLPNANACPGETVTVKKLNASGYTAYIAAANSSQFVGGYARTLLIGINSYITLISDGSNWHVVDVSDFIVNTNVSSPSVPTSGQYGDLEQIASVNGVWEMTLVYDILNNGATVTDAIIGMGTATGNSSAGLIFGFTEIGVKLPNAASHGSGVIHYQYVGDEAASLWWKHMLTYTVATPKYNYSITMRRIG